MEFQGLKNIENISSRAINLKKSPYIIETIKPNLKEDYERDGWEFIPSKLKHSIRMKKEKSHDKFFEDNEVKYAVHDIVLYDISVNLSRNEFFESLRKSFNKHPFIEKFKNSVRKNNPYSAERKGSMRFGEVRAWFSNNTTTVPTPRPW